MKKIFIIFVILSEMLFALTISIERNKNSIIPYYLKLGQNETLLSISNNYDTLTHKDSMSANLHLYIKLFSKKKTIKKIKNKKHLYIRAYQFKSSLGIRLIHKKPSLELKSSYKLTYKNIILYEQITPAIPIFYKEKTIFQYKYNNKIFFIDKSFTYKKSGMDYSFGINTYGIYLPKFVRSVTFSLNGNTSIKPFIYSYNISTSYRFSIMNKKDLYLNINPYILISKKYHFKIKPAAKFSINYNF